jgi:3-methylcrotonyl-CoA carboxylase beta subunit
VKAATGQVVSADELGGCDLHTRTSGTCDYPAANEEEAIAIARDVVAQWRRAPKCLLPDQSAEPPLLDPDDLYGIIPDDIKQTFDMREVLGRIVDGSRFHEYKPAYGTTLICGFAHLHGYRVGVLANNGILFNDSAIKGGHFIELCNQNDTPLLFLQNITGYMVGREYEQAGITKDGAKMIMAQACSHVPKLTVMCHGSFGAGNYGMCGRAFDGRFLFSWPNHQIAVMGGEQAAKTLVEVKLRQLERAGQAADKNVLERVRSETLQAYEEQISADYSTSELWDDGMLDPVDTRNALGIALSASLNAPLGSAGNGVFRF